MMRRLVEPTPVLARINVTPVIDVALVLVIILLITAPMLAVAQLGLDLPEAKSQILGDEHRINVTFGRDGELAIGEDVIPRGAFARELAARLAEEGAESLVVIRADSRLPHGTVREFVEEARAAGAARLAFATRPPDREGVR